MARPKGSLNKATLAKQASGKIDLGTGVPASPAPATATATKEPVKKALGRVTKEKVFSAAAGQLTVHESQNQNIVFKGRMTDENGIVFMTTVLMPLKPYHG